MANEVAVVTGAAGAIGAGICRVLLDEGCHVVATDLPGPRLESLAAEMKLFYGDRILTLPMDVTDETSIRAAFDQVCAYFGGIDLLVPNAGIALVRRLEDLSLAEFRTLERVNVEGTLLFIKAGIDVWRRQGTGGDIVLISTKNVPCPGASFGAYSSTKAAAHQIARIASLELADIGVRVNMVSPDAVFSEGQRKSGLWEVCGPDRMKARGLDEDGLMEYYRNRNLLKIQVTAHHVGRAVLFFATRQTPTTGATIPVDGGLPDAVPR